MISSCRLSLPNSLAPSHSPSSVLLPSQRSLSPSVDNETTLFAFRNTHSSTHFQQHYHTRLVAAKHEKSFQVSPLLEAFLLLIDKPSIIVPPVGDNRPVIITFCQSFHGRYLFDLNCFSLGLSRRDVLPATHWCFDSTSKRTIRRVCTDLSHPLISSILTIFFAFASFLNRHNRKKSSLTSQPSFVFSIHTSFPRFVIAWMVSF